MRQRKLHLHNGSIPSLDHHFSACGQLFEGKQHPLLYAKQLVWLPVERQCVKCHATLVHGWPGHGAPDVDGSTCDTHSATPLMLTTIEVVMHAFGDWLRSFADTTHAERGCYFEICHEMAGGRRQYVRERSVCHCGRFSYLDWASAQVMATDARDAIIAELNTRARAQTIEAFLEWTA